MCATTGSIPDCQLERSSGDVFSINLISIQFNIDRITPFEAVDFCLRLCYSSEADSVPSYLCHLLFCVTLYLHEGPLITEIGSRSEQ